MINNRLKNQRCYLAGAMDRVPDRGKTWRQYITPFLQSIGVTVLDPLRKPTNLGLENDDTVHYKLKLKKEKNYDELSKLMKEIRAVDLRMVDISDFLVVNLNIETHPCGTLEEIFWANRQKKPILIHIEQGKENTPDWLFGTIPHEFMFSSWTELEQYLLYINSSGASMNLNRWCFFEI